MAKYLEYVDKVIGENKTVLSAVDEREINMLIDAIINARKIQIFGMGRMKCATWGFTMRLMHMGFDVQQVFDVTCPCIGEGDLLIVNCAVTTVSLGIMKLAKQAGARVCAITAHPENEHGEIADFTVFVPGQIFGGPREVKSMQPMASLLEQSLLLFEDIVTLLLMERLKITSERMEKRHTNLEGVLGHFA